MLKIALRLACSTVLLSPVLTAQAADLTHVRFVYDWPHADFEIIPTVVAQQMGFYEALGLQTDVIMPPDSQTTGRMLAVGQADIGFEATTDVIFAANQGIPIQSIGLYSQTNNWGLFAKPGVKVSLQDLKGKTIGIYADSWTKAMMPFVIKAAGLKDTDVQQIIAPSANMPLMLAGKVDLAANVTNYAVPQTLAATQAEPGMLIGTAIGVPDVPVWAYTAAAPWLKGHGDIAKKWLAATAKGMQWSSEHPAEAVAMYMKAYPEGGTLEYNTKAWSLTIPLLKGDKGYLVQDDSKWLPLAQALKDTDQIKQVLPGSGYYTNAVMP